MLRAEELCNKWPNRPLSEVSDFLDHMRRPVKAVDRKPGPYPYYGANGQQGTIDGYIFDEPLILLAEDGGYFGDPKRPIAYRISGKSWVNNHAHVLRVRDGILDTSFLFRVLSYYDVRPFITGTTRAKLIKGDASKIPIPLPPLSEQRRIVEILDRADELRKKRTEADVIGVRILPALFYKMFGDPATNPKGWGIKPLSDFEAQVRYGLGQPPKTSTTGLALVRATNISRGTIGSKNMIYVDPQDVPLGRNAFLKEDEVLVVRSGAYTGDIAQVTKEWEGCVAGYDLVITPGRYLTGEFVEAYLLMPFIQKGYFYNLKARAGQPHLNAAQVAATPIFDVPRDLQVQFSENVKAIRILRRQRTTASENLEKVFTVMLHRAFTGDLTTKWRDAHMKELLQEMEQQAKSLNLRIES